MTVGKIAAWAGLLTVLSFSIGAARAFGTPQGTSRPRAKISAVSAPEKEANPAAKSSADSPEFKKLAARATEARQQNRVQEAADLYAKALRLNPNWQEGWWYLGALDYDANKYSDGVRAFSNVVEMNRKNLGALAMLGLCEFETRSYANALIHLQMAWSKRPRTRDDLGNVVEYHLALLDILHSDFETANKLLSDLVQHNILSENVERALGLTLLRVPLLPDQIDPEKDALVSEAGRTGELEALEDFNEADTSFQKLVHDYPTTPFVHYAYAEMLVGLSEYEKAEAELREELKLNPESAMPYLLSAYVDERLNRFQDALPLAREAVKRSSQSFVAHYLLGRALLATNNVTDAINELTEAKHLAPESPDVRYNLAIALAKAKRPKEAAAEEAEFRRLNAAAESSRSGGQSDISSPSKNSNETGEIEPDQLRSPPGGDPHQ